MSALEAILQQIDQLSAPDRQKLRQHLLQTPTTDVYSMSGEAFRDVYEAFAPVREETSDMTENEIDDFLREVIEEVREESRASGRI